MGNSQKKKEIIEYANKGFKEHNIDIQWTDFDVNIAPLNRDYESGKVLMVKFDGETYEDIDGDRLADLIAGGKTVEIKWLWGQFGPQDAVRFRQNASSPWIEFDRYKDGVKKIEELNNFIFHTNEEREKFV